MSDPFTFRRIGTTGCEILFNGSVVGWAVDEVWTTMIVAKLNNDPRVAVGAGIGLPEAVCCRKGLTAAHTHMIHNVRGAIDVRLPG